METRSAAARELVKMSALARRSEVPSATIKHYLREGLLPGPVRRTGRTMAYYDAALVPRIRAIKQLQREHFLPLSVIKGVLDGHRPLADDDTTAAAIVRVLRGSELAASRSRAELLASGTAASDLDWLDQMGLLSGEQLGADVRYSGDDVALLRTLGAARKAGITPEMLPLTILGEYAHAIRELVRTELALFRQGVIPRAGERLPELTETAARLSERLVVLIRRKLLLPTLRQLTEEAAAGPARAPHRTSRGNQRKRRA